MGVQVSDSVIGVPVLCPTETGSSYSINGECLAVILVQVGLYYHSNSVHFSTWLHKHKVKISGIDHEADAECC